MFIDILILSQLIHGPKHGYKIKKNVTFLLGDYKLNNNALYPRLKKFEEMGAIVKEVEVQEGTPNRFLYTITGKGRELFEKLLQEVTEETASDDNEFYNRLGFFSLLGKENKDKILNFRIQYLQKQLDLLKEMIQTVSEEDYIPFSQQLYVYSREKMEHEIKLVESLRNIETEL